MASIRYLRVYRRVETMERLYAAPVTELLMLKAFATPSQSIKQSVSSERSRNLPSMDAAKNTFVTAVDLKIYIFIENKTHDVIELQNWSGPTHIRGNARLRLYGRIWD
jgi:hypothetical protein